MSFEELGVSDEILAQLDSSGWHLPTPVQSESVGLILGGGDVCAAAETGSGKTLAFTLPTVQLAHEVLSANVPLPSSKIKGGGGSSVERGGVEGGAPPAVL